MEENKCSHLDRDNIKLPESDALKTIYDNQIKLQERFGRIAKSKNMNMHEKCKMVMEEIFCINAELTEMMDRLPFKHWKNYSSEKLEGWENQEQRDETLYEYIDVFHFFLNIGIILGFSVDEIFNYYLSKNKENHDRQDRGY